MILDTKARQFDPNDLLGECSKEGEFCIMQGISIKACCEGLECSGFPIKSCKVPQGKFFENLTFLVRY